jgi:CspA family cold shock protein
MATQKNGTIKWFNSEKGFGFIQLDDNSQDIFVHYSQVQSKSYGRVSLDEGQKVSLEIGKNEKGSFAQNVVVL